MAFMDINPATEGHVLVVPRRHSRDLHVIPRYVGDGLHPPWIPRVGDRERISAAAGRLRAIL